MSRAYMEAVPETYGEGLYGAGLFEDLFPPLEQLAQACLPRLRTLCIHGNRHLSFVAAEPPRGVAERTAKLVAFLRACPALEELHAADVDVHFPNIRAAERYQVLQRAVSQLPHPALRIQTHERAPLPRALDIACALCDAPLWRGLTRFCLAPKIQLQQASVVYTSVLPAPEDISSFDPGLERDGNGVPLQIMCKNGCHARRHFYLADAGSPFMRGALHGWRFIIAVNPVQGLTDAGVQSPPLTVLKLV